MQQENMPNETVEVTVDETNKAIQTSEQEPNVEVSESPTVDTEVESKSKEDETVEYSASVKKRIDKLTKRLREAERREESALQYAQGVQKEANDIKSKYETLDKNYIDEFGSRVNNQLDLAKNKLKNAIATRNVDQQIEANEEIARLTIDSERIKYSKQLQDQKKPEETTQNQVENQVNQQVNKPKADPKAIQWAERNEWFGEDAVMTEAAKAIHKNLVLEENVDPSSDLYYDKLDKKIREYFPQRFNDGGSPEVTKVAQPVASATRTNKASGRRTVKLSPSQAAMAKRLGVTLEQYAKYVKEA
jgi:hypothetical protein|tara:strand:+ start:6398 stop:7309 length:912 start_codon:yes stop_codon:yes gene_type:complete